MEGLPPRADPAVAAVAGEGQLHLGEQVASDAPLPEGLVQGHQRGRDAVHLEAIVGGVHLNPLEAQVHAAEAGEGEAHEDDVAEFGEGVQLRWIGLELLGPGDRGRPQGRHGERNGLLPEGRAQREQEEGKGVAHGTGCTGRVLSM